MRHNKVIGFALAGLVTLGGASCNVDKFLDVNDNPNNAIAAPPTVLLPSTIISTAFSNGNEINRITSLLVQHVAGVGTQSQPQDRYNIRGGLDNQWQFEQYAGVLQNSQTLIESAGTLNSPAYAGIGKLLKAYNFAMVTDLWGDIPYSEALQGLNKLQPRFDRQEDIYKGAAGIQSLDDLIKEGLADLDAMSTLTPSSTDDPVYSGNLARWKRMGNTLRLKLANTISRREPALARTIINEVIAGNNFINANADDFEVAFGGAVGNRNPIYDFNGVNLTGSTPGQRPLDILMSQRLLDSMAVRNDPRLPIYFNTVPAMNAMGMPVAGVTTTSVGSFRAFQNGAVAALTQVPAERSKYFTYLTGNSGEAPIRLLTNFQRLFIMAESALVLGTSTGGAANTVQSLYRDAIRASMTKTGLTNAQVDAYFAANPQVANLSSNQTLALNQIMTQKWIAWVGNGYEAYNDYRRTGFPRLALVLNAEGDNPNVLPKRFVYPASELSGNANNAPSDVPDTTLPVWWDVD